MKDQSERSILPGILNLGVTGGLVANATPRPLYPRVGDPASIVQEAGWAPEPVWTGGEKFRSHGTSIRGPSRKLGHLLYIVG